MPPQARLGDKALIPADAHGCVACPHTASGPAVAGSPNVNVNGRPAIRVDDPGIHTACCGGNTWNAQTGSKSVFINGKPAHRLGDAVRHCGGVGKCIEGSGNVFVGDSGGSGFGKMSTRLILSGTSAPPDAIAASRVFLDRICSTLNATAAGSLPENLLHTTVTISQLDPELELLFTSAIKVAKIITSLIEKGPFAIADLLWELNCFLAQELGPILGKLGKVWQGINKWVVRIESLISSIIPETMEVVKKILRAMIARLFLHSNNPRSCPVGHNFGSATIKNYGSPQKSRELLAENLNILSGNPRLYDATEYFTDLLTAFRPHVFSFAEDLVPVSIEQLLIGRKFFDPDNQKNGELIQDLSGFAAIVTKLPDRGYTRDIRVPYIDLGDAERQTGNKGGTVYARALVCPRDYNAYRAVILEYTFIRPVSFWFSPDQSEGFLFEHEGDNERCAIVVRAEPSNSSPETWAVSGVAFEMHGAKNPEEYKGLNSCGDHFRFPEATTGSVSFVPSSKAQFNAGGPDRVNDGRPQVFIARGSHAICAESGYRDLPVWKVNGLDLYPESTSDNELDYVIKYASDINVRDIVYCGHNKYALGNYNLEGILLNMEGEYQTPKPKDYYQKLDEADGAST